MRIALDATYSIDPQPSGIAIYSRELMQGLAIQHPDDRFDHCYRPKQLRKAPRPSAANVRNRLLLPPLPTFIADVYHALNQRVDRRPAKAVVSTFHDLFVITGNYSSRDFRDRFTEQARQAASRSDLIIAVSKFTARQVEELLGFESSRIRVIPHGVRTPAVGLQDPIIGREKLILFVGALQTRKNVGRLVAAMDQLPRDWRLVLAGSLSGFQAEQILQQIARSRSKQRIELAGYVSADQLEHLYSRASVFAFPSLAEGFGMPVLEAMARGVPVLTSSSSALCEVAGDAALLVDPEDQDAIAGRLRLLIQDETLRLTLGKKGRKHAAQFSWDRAVRETWTVYRELSRGYATSP